jgi:methyl coenzyme M reductase subunit C-like uncharacterized protein (methanogenesis marker protein 7)
MYMDDELLEIVGDLCGFILEEIIMTHDPT